MSADSFVSQLAYFFAQASLASQHKQYPVAGSRKPTSSFGSMFSSLHLLVELVPTAMTAESETQDSTSQTRKAEREPEQP